MHRSVLLIPLVVLVSIPAAVPGQVGLLSQVRAAGALRVCADPTNLPFSSDEPAASGFDVELAGAIARLLEVREEIRWEPTFLGQRALRQLLEGRCDLFMGLPHDPRFLAGNRRLALSTPYYTLRHVLISTSAKPVADLSGMGSGRVAVERGSMADIYLFNGGYNRYVYRNQTEAFGGVAGGEADGALLWEPVARWLMTRHAGPRLQAVVVSGPDLDFKVAVGMRAGDGEFHAAVDEAVKRLVQQGKIDEVFARYGMPAAPRAEAPRGSPAPRIVSAQAGDQAAEDSRLRQGRSLYFQMCAPCHGPDASGGGPIGPLKSFNGSREDFVQITLNGRLAKGMPPFEGSVSADEVDAVRAFVLTLAK